ncbi:hypothetical protein AWC38_SpisGene21552 [Stylophora pistillata]|uniref:Uncharacterized protein n=1 Tax=Stylophora pistillata TaxID=50429 RepID=A0A2B4RBX6_STYPI|nr:hypothetical protein AWC38_SpisGene21552 [Stylophora pistillata]
MRVLDVARQVSRKKTAHTLEVSTSESEEEEDDIPLTGKYTITSTLALTSTCGIHLVRPFSVCSGRRIMQDYPEFYIGDTKQGKVFKITDVKLTTQCSGRLRELYPAAANNISVALVALVFYQEQLFIANADTNEPGICVIHANRGTLLSTITSPLISTPSGMCLADKCLFVSCGNHTILKISQVFYIDHYRGAARFSFREAMSLLDKLVEFLMMWDEQTRQRTTRTATQGPDQVLSYTTRRSMEMMRGSLSRLQNFLSELGAKDLLAQIRLSALVTLMVENLFSLMRQEDPMPTQLEYGIRRTTCVRELEKRMYRGHFHYFTGPKSYYPDKVLDSPPPPKPSISLIEDQMEKLSHSDTNELREFASSFEKSVRQHTVRDKSKEDTGQLP